MISPLPIVTEATIAPGPKNRNQCRGFRESKAGGGATNVSFFFTAIPSDPNVGGPSMARSLVCASTRRIDAKCALRFVFLRIMG